MRWFGTEVGHDFAYVGVTRLLRQQVLGYAFAGEGFRATVKFDSGATRERFKREEEGEHCISLRESETLKEDEGY